MRTSDPNRRIFSGIPSILVHSGYYNKISHTGWFINSTNVFLTVLEAGSLRSGCQQDLFLLQAEEVSVLYLFSSFLWLLGILGILRLVDASLQSLLPLSQGFLPFVPVSKFPSYKDTSHWSRASTVGLGTS